MYHWYNVLKHFPSLSVVYLPCIVSIAHLLHICNRSYGNIWIEWLDCKICVTGIMLKHFSTHSVAYMPYIVSIALPKHFSTHSIAYIPYIVSIAHFSHRAYRPLGYYRCRGELCFLPPHVKSLSGNVKVLAVIVGNSSADCWRIGGNSPA